MKLELLPGIYVVNLAVWIPKHKLLAIADVHIGLTKELWENGVSLPSQVKLFISRLNKLKKLTKNKK
ncbi:MAG: hypothetical protein AABX59_02995 [Nanoarchaeota archaeon]